MKKFIAPITVITVLIFALTAMSGCQIFSNKAPEQGTIDHVPQDRRIGMIQSLGGIRTSNAGTNILTLDDGSTILLKSLAINLDDPKYLSNKIEVSGVLTYTTDGKQIMEVQSIDVLDTAVVTQELVAVTWRDYVNAGLKFQLKYRDDFTVAESGDSVTFTRAVSPNAIVNDASQQSLPTAHVITVQMKNPGSMDIIEGKNKSKIGMDGIEAYKNISSDGNLNFSFNNGSNFYTISYSGGNDSQSLEDQNVFYDVLSSFKLLDPSPALTQQAVFTSVPATAVTVAVPKPATAPAPVVVAPTPVVAAPVSAPVAPATPAPAVTPAAPVAAVPPVTGYETFTSSGYKFSIQYPKGWYFGQAVTSETGVARRYNFGTKAVDVEPGSVNLDIGSSLSGSAGEISFTFSGKNGRIYRLSGPASMSGTLNAMIGTIVEM